jgi:predicted RNase H-like nuclease (RuvC/YqgF family)
VLQERTEANTRIFLPNATETPVKAVYKLMGDPRNVAHDKKVVQEKHHKEKHAQKTPSPKRATTAQTDKNKQATISENAVAKPEHETPPQEPASAQLEKSLAVLSKLKELEFHSRANIEKLAELSLTIEEELKQKTFAEGIGTVYAAQNVFQSKILELIDGYQTECTRLSGSA